MASRYRSILKYMTGEEEVPENLDKLSLIFIKRIMKDEHVKNLVEGIQEGQGKLKKPRYLVDLHIKHIKKTQGLIRKFKPTLWTKIPV